MRKITAAFLTFVLLAPTAPAASAKPKGDWDDVRSLVGQAVAVKSRDGVTSFGILGSADDTGMKVQVAGKGGLERDETFFRREDVEKVWQARLRFGERNTKKGAWIGAGAGLGAGFLTAMVLSKRESTAADACVGCGLFPIYGAGVGALVGSFSRKGHKKGKLIYSA